MNMVGFNKIYESILSKFSWLGWVKWNRIYIIFLKNSTQLINKFLVCLNGVKECENLLFLISK